MLQIKVDERADCKEVHDYLTRYYERCLRDVEYVTVTLPTFEEPEASRPHASVPRIHVTNHSGEIQQETHSIGSSHQKSDISAGPTTNKASTNGAAVSKSGERIATWEQPLTQNDELGDQSERNETREAPRRNRAQRMFRSLRFCHRFPWRRREPNV
jgi:hypothetical protein